MPLVVCRSHVGGVGAVALTLGHNNYAQSQRYRPREVNAICCSSGQALLDEVDLAGMEPKQYVNVVMDNLAKYAERINFQAADWRKVKCCAESWQHALQMDKAGDIDEEAMAELAADDDVPDVGMSGRSSSSASQPPDVGMSGRSSSSASQPPDVGMSGRSSSSASQPPFKAQAPPITPMPMAKIEAVPVEAKARPTGVSKFKPGEMAPQPPSAPPPSAPPPSAPPPSAQPPARAPPPPIALLVSKFKAPPPPPSTPPPPPLALPEAEEVPGGRDVKRARPDGWCPQCHVLREECFKPGDWACAFCGQHNYSDKIACSNWRCNRDKEVAADEDAAEVAGLASVRAANPITGWCDSCGRWRLQCWKPNDWECPQCTNHNYARKQALRQQ